MTYGQESTDSLWDDSVDTSQQGLETQQPQQPQLDPNKYVPVEKYQELEQNFNSIQPKLEQLDRLGQVFNPQQQQPQYTPEESAIVPVLQKLLAPVFQQQQEQREAESQEYLEDVAKQYGTRGSQLTNWFYLTQDEMSHAYKNNGDQEAGNLAYKMAQLNQKGDVKGLVRFVQQNIDKINGYAPMKLPNMPRPQAQSFGHGFNNTAMNPVDDIKAKVEAARKAGNQAEIQRLSQEYMNSISPQSQSRYY